MKKLFTHTLVIYRNGWCWRWEPNSKEEGVTTYCFSELVSLLAFVAIVKYLFF